ncbi:ficolin-3-like [Anopheles aquasalis]|uniref:ficolin-3-like n=1 Tax=Anopheles aquasalis TaxID=42839 RepID=UPI00215B687B|nr:ficolin-3-like [Anopheles aquasalis]
MPCVRLANKCVPEMKLHVWYFMFCAVICVEASAINSTGYGQLILTKLELMANKLHTLENKLESLENQFNEHRSSQDTLLHKLDRNVETVLQNQRGPIFSTCKTQQTNISGTYSIHMNNESAPFSVYCEQQAYGGGWIVIQHRYDGSLDFYRSWDEFQDGFGDLEKEFWLGLENIHQITKGRKHELMIELKDFNGTYKYAHYDAFEIGSEGEQFMVKAVGAYNGTAGEAMQDHNGKKFSTKDRDNDDERHDSCVEIREGAWWHGDCLGANLNGQYLNTVDSTAMTWFTFNSKWQGLSFSRMMIREINRVSTLINGVA